MRKINHNHPILKTRRKELRNNMTPEEVVLWNYLRNSRLGFKFRRQTSIGPYIADFYCSSCNLIIELDGNYHKDNKEYDLERDKFLSSKRIAVVRFENKEIHESINKVIEKVRSYLK